MERKNAWKTYSEEDISKLNAISAEYVKFLDNGKTERECVAQTVEMAKAKGSCFSKSANSPFSRV